MNEVEKLTDRLRRVHDVVTNLGHVIAMLRASAVHDGEAISELRKQLDGMTADNGKLLAENAALRIYNATFGTK